MLIFYILSIVSAHQCSKWTKKKKYEFCFHKIYLKCYLNFFLKICKMLYDLYDLKNRNGIL